MQRCGGVARSQIAYSRDAWRPFADPARNSLSARRADLPRSGDRLIRPRQRLRATVYRYGAGPCLRKPAARASRARGGSLTSRVRRRVARGLSSVSSAPVCARLVGHQSQPCRCQYPFTRPRRCRRTLAAPTLTCTGLLPPVSPPTRLFTPAYPRRSLPFLVLETHVHPVRPLLRPLVTTLGRFEGLVSLGRSA